MSTHQEDVGFVEGLKHMLSLPDRSTSYPNIVRLWIAAAVLPLSTVESERWFSRQNVIKSWLRVNLCDAKLGELMIASLLSYDMEWPALVARWRASKKRRPANDVLLAGGERHSKRTKKSRAATAEAAAAAAAAATATVAAAEAAARETALAAEAARLDAEFPWLSRRGKEKNPIPVPSDSLDTCSEDYSGSDSD
ncbi:unnamed protein product [Closterium sp. NIES-54]